MSRATVPLEAVVGGLRAEGLLREEQAAEADALIAELRAGQPWYVRAMVAVGAWLASFQVIGFVAAFGIMVGGYVIVGLALIAGAVALRRKYDNDFVVQATLAASLAGQALLAWGIADLGDAESIELLCTVIIVMSGVLFFIFPDRIHRVLSVLFAASALTVLLYAWEWNAAVPVLGPALAAALVLVHRNRAALTAAGHGHLVRPLESGLMLSAFGCLLLSTVYLLPELDLEFVFYPRPWISTLLLGALFLYVGSFTLQPLAAGTGRAAVPVTYALMLAVIACAWAAPGLLLALIVTLLGAGAGQRTFTGAGIAFLAVFVTAYFYGMETTLLTKSITLVATGAAVLVARWILLLFVRDRHAGDTHA